MFNGFVNDSRPHLRRRVIVQNIAQSDFDTFGFVLKQIGLYHISDNAIGQQNIILIQRPRSFFQTQVSHIVGDVFAAQICVRFNNAAPLRINRLRADTGKKKQCRDRRQSCFKKTFHCFSPFRLPEIRMSNRYSHTKCPERTQIQYRRGCPVLLNGIQPFLSARPTTEAPVLWSYRRFSFPYTRSALSSRQTAYVHWRRH